MNQPSSPSGSGKGACINRLEFLGQVVEEFDELTSTSNVVREQALAGAPEGRAVLARSQTRGRGRRGRVWASAAGEGVYLSVLLRPALDAADVGWLAVAGGVAVAQALAEMGIRGVRLKWPNDVLVGGRKIAGVLVEPRLASGRVEFAVVGIGVNIRQAPQSWPADIRDVATSCALEGVDTDCRTAARAVLASFEAAYARVVRREFNGLMEQWSKLGGYSQLPVVD